MRLGPARRVVSSYHPSGLIETRQGRMDFAPGSDTVSRGYEYYYNENRSLVVTRDHRWIFNPFGPPIRRTNIARDAAERERHVNETWAAGRDTTIAYDDRGNVTRRRVDVLDPENDESGRRHRFAYDELSREVEMLVRGDGGERQTTTEYFASGDVRQFAKPNGTTEAMRWRADGLMDRKVRDPEMGDPEPQPYDYDTHGNRTRDEKGEHTYNARDQLVLWNPDKGGENHVSYRLNGAGQTLAKLDADSDEDDDADVTYTYVGDEENGERLKQVVSEFPTDTPTLRQTYTYDDMGNVVRIQAQSEQGGAFPDAGEPVDNPCTNANWTDEASTYFCFDEFSRQVTSQAPGEDEPELVVYDGLDRRDFRLTEDGSGGEFTHIGSSNMLSREKRVNGDVATYDYNSRGERQGQRYHPEGGGDPTYRSYAHDAQGSVTGLEGQQGQLPDDRTYDYDPYGDLEDPDPSNEDEAEDELAPAAQENPFRFQGHYYDSAIKTYDMHARSYRPEAGRFLSEDRYQAAGADIAIQTDPLTQNRYAFAGGNPTTNIEFDGHLCGYMGTKCDPKKVRQSERELKRMGLAGDPSAGGGGGTAGAGSAGGSSSNEPTIDDLRQQALDVSRPGEIPLSDYSEEHPNRIQVEDYVADADREELLSFIETNTIANNTVWECGPVSALIVGCSIGESAFNAATLGAGTKAKAAGEGLKRAGGLIKGFLDDLLGRGGSKAAGGVDDIMARLPAYSGGKTSGILDAGGRKIDLLSGYKGPSAALPRGTPGMNNRIKAHVEAHAAAVMRQEGLSSATLYINRVPCPGVTGCNAMLPRMLPEGASLQVYGPGGFSRRYTGLPD